VVGSIGVARASAVAAVPVAPPHRPSRFLATSIVAVPAVVLVAAALARWSHGYGGVDLAILDQALWAASHGHGLFSSVLRENLLGDHFEPGMLLFVPLYRVVPTAAWLLIGQGVAAATAALLVVGRLRTTLDATRRALLAAAILLSPPVAFALQFDAHGLVFAAPFALGAVFAAEDDRPRRAAVLGVLAAMFRLEAGLGVVVAMAVLGRGHRRARSFALAAVGAYLPLAYVLEGRLGAGDDHWTGHFDRLGSSPADALAHPWRIVLALVSVSALSKAVPWLVTSGFLCFRRPRWMLPAMAAGLPVLASSWPGTSSWVFHYGYLPMFLLALAWLPVVKDRPGSWRWVAVSCLALNVLASPLVPSIDPAAAGTSFAAPVWTRPADADRLAVTRDVPANAVVSGDYWTLALVAHRTGLYLWPFPFAAAGRQTLPNPQLQRPDAALAAMVDVVIVPRDQANLVPAGFVIDRATATYVRFRRVGEG
jgi:hypothetical protein